LIKKKIWLVIDSKKIHFGCNMIQQRPEVTCSHF
jgi:hypothetical protein